MDLSWPAWLSEVASLLDDADFPVTPETIVGGYRDTPRELYERGCSPKEAADFLRQ